MRTYEAQSIGFTSHGIDWLNLRAWSDVVVSVPELCQKFSDFWKFQFCM